MNGRRAGMVVVGLVGLLAAGLAWWLVRPAQPPAVTTTPAMPPQPNAPPQAPQTPDPVQAPPPPAPHPPGDLGPAEVLSLPMPDGNPLRARWYAGTNARAPVLVLDAGAGARVSTWLPLVQALLAQRPVRVLWVDDVQPLGQAVVPRAVARWQAALGWLDGHAPGVRAALVGAREAASVLPRVATHPRPLSLALLDPQPAPEPTFLPAAAEKFTLVALPAGPTPTWVSALHNVHTQVAAAPDDPRFAADVAGWLFAALGPR